jgi:hypothetical protein
MKRHPSLFAAALLLAGCGGADARTITVTSDTELADAVAKARAGDRIQLAPGRYSQLRIANRRIEGAPVTIMGAASADRPTVANIDIDKSSGWSFDSLDVGGSSGRRGRVVMVTNSTDIAIRNNLIHGLTINNDPWDEDVTGIGVRNSERVEVSGNRLRDLGSGVSVAESSEVLFQGNSIAFVREGSHWVATRKATLRCNRISHMFPNLLRKEHPDAIQGWPNKTGNNTDTLIEGNVLSLGGPRAVQGIFMEGRIAPPGSDQPGGIRNLIVRDNIYYGSSLHGISLGGLENALVERNTVLPSPHTQTEPPPVRSEDGRRSAAIVPRLRTVGDQISGIVRGNIAPRFTIEPGMQDANNLIVSGRSDGGKAWRKIFATPPTGDDPPLESFLVDPKSPAGKAGQGARAICGNLLPPAVGMPSGLDPSMASWPG